MPVVSITRLHLRSLRFFPAFALHTWRSTQQIRASQGFLVGRFANELPYAFWTMSVWESMQAMRGFRDAGAHHVAMGKLLNWCDEASFVHWEQPDAALPSIATAHERLRTGGRTSKVRFPSPEHAAGQTASSRLPTAAPDLKPTPR